MGVGGRIGRSTLTPDERRVAAARRDVENIRHMVEGAERAIAQQTVIRDRGLEQLAEAEAKLAGMLSS